MTVRLIAAFILGSFLIAVPLINSGCHHHSGQPYFGAV